MAILTAILTTGFFLLIPAAMLMLAARFAMARTIGPIVLCYIIGVLIGVGGLIPAAADATRLGVMEAALGLALPLLLFSVDLRAWRSIAGRALLSMGLAIVAVTTLSVVLYHVFAGQGTARAEQLSGMAVGMYTGGIANLGAIKLALDIPDTRYLVFATMDTLIGAFYLLFVLTIAKTVFAKLLSAFGSQQGQTADVSEADERYGDLVTRAMARPVVSALLAAAICVALSLVLARIIPVASPQITVIVLLTTFGIAGSFIPALQSNPAAPKLGMYLIFVFSVCVAAGLDLSSLANPDLGILMFVVIATFGSLVLHALLCRLFRVDVDTFLITSVAAIMSPAFVPMVARALKNPAVLMSGMATGIIGFAIGNYLGITIALLLASGTS